MLNISVICFFVWETRHKKQISCVTGDQVALYFNANAQMDHGYFLVLKLLLNHVIPKMVKKLSDLRFIQKLISLQEIQKYL